MDELQEMREQMAALKEKLNKQEIVNAKNLRLIKWLVWKVRIPAWFIIVLFGGILIALVYLTFSMEASKEEILSNIYLIVVVAGVAANTAIPAFLLKMKDVRSGNMLKVAEQFKKVKNYVLNVMFKVIGTLAALLILYLVLFYMDKEPLLAKIGIISMLITMVPLYWLPSWQSYQKMIVKNWLPKEWEEYIRQAEEISELDEEKEDTEK
jgi:uncharacterized protein YacL